MKRSKAVSKQSQKGFTLIELLIVIGIIAILAAIIFVAVDPARRFAEARNAERSSSTNSILNAYLKYVVDNTGTHPTTTQAGGASLSSSEYYMIGSDNADIGNDTCTAQAVSGTIDLSGLVDEYIASIPIDPYGVDNSWASATSTKYYFRKSGNGRITIGACEPETVGGSTPTISVSR